MPTLDTAIMQGDCVKLMQELPAGTVDLVFADPPFNIGYEYDKYDDEKSDDDYLNWSRIWLSEVYRLLTPAGSFWLAIGDDYAADLKVLADRQVGFTMRSWVIWYYTFGVNCTKKFSRSHTHLFHFVKDPNRFTFNADDSNVRVKSARELVYGDKRANPRGRLPDDTWILRPQDFQSDQYGFDPSDDTWYFARVAGTFKERQGFHGCQMPEQLLGRILRVSSNLGDLVFDPFAGSGTTLAVAKKLGRKWQGCELSEEYVRYAEERLDTIVVGGQLDGPADPIASAPTTANGRRLKSPKVLDASTAPTASHINVDAVFDTASPAVEIEQSPTSTKSDFQNVSRLQPFKVVSPLGNRQHLRQALRDAIVDAFTATHDGYSADWLLCSQKLQDAFHSACKDAGLIGNAADWNRELMRIRKQGKLAVTVTKKTVVIAPEELDTYSFAAEIAWRTVSDKFGGASLDEILMDPQKAKHFDKIAQHWAPGYLPEQFRREALRLRKRGKTLASEVQDFHFLFDRKEFKGRSLWNRPRRNTLDGQPGVYLLHDLESRPFYIGHCQSLGARLSAHESAAAVSRHISKALIIASDELPPLSYIEAFKCELVKRYVPRKNIDLTTSISGT